MLQNINDGTFPALGMSTSLGWNESFLPEDYPSEYPRLGLSPNGDFSCDEDIFANNFLPGPSRVASNTGELFEELSQRVRDYPKKILQRDFWSPFIHHSLYRCAQGGMAEGIALACASAYDSCVESSSSFINTMINTQREKLIREFHL
ncbi:hypothetical protein H109_00671 [Trichophyton interdigitale MR816]|uniref:Uncharacterized protein n=1 Tax=Trichophyton interdigitale (strain MR816) TaxID=1215338 RepID=A0A059JI15_TRIIM|nr:hypothetical protein H101_03013 [Trichophyton interdigitale H6]KDB27510.1 hypothetical protein H109_00671 [Trichophyton interdigitale MR816]